MAERLPEDGFWIDVYVYPNFTDSMKAHDQLKEAIIRGKLKGVFHHGVINTDDGSSSMHHVSLYGFHQQSPDEIVLAKQILNHTGQKVENVPERLKNFAKSRVR